MKVELCVGDKLLRRATNGWIVAECVALDDGVETIAESVVEDRDGDDEGIIGAIDMLFERRQMKRSPGYTVEWHSKGREEEAATGGAE